MMSRKPRHPMKRVDVSALVKRLVDANTISIKRDIILFYKVFSETGRWDFWRVYDPGFALPSMAYYLTDAGRLKWKVDLALFDLDIEAESSYDMSADKQGEDRMVRRATVSVADLLG